VKLTVIPVTPFAQNSTLLVCEQTHRAAVTDPGGDLERIEAALEKSGASLEKILLTHGHLDHCAGAPELAARHGVPIIGPQREEKFWIAQLAQQARKFGFPPAAPFEPDQWLEDGDTVTVGATQLQVRHCPGHTPGHVVLHSVEAGRAFVGDLLFAGSIGRTDLPGGDHATLIESIKGRLWPMGDETVFIPGHGPESSFGRERRSNPYLRSA